MTTKEYLLVQLVSECAEVAHIVTKAIHFGLSEKMPGQEKTNLERVMEEWTDLQSTMHLLQEERILPTTPIVNVKPKIDKIKRYMTYAEMQCKTLSAD